MTKVYLLGFMVTLWSGATVGYAACEEYWQVVLMRVLIAIATAGCNNNAAAIISDYFMKEIRGTAISILYFGLPLGMALTYGPGNIFTDLIGYRLTLIVLASPGVLLGILLAVSIKNKRHQPHQQLQQPQQQQRPPGTATTATKTTVATTDQSKSVQENGDDTLPAGRVSVTVNAAIVRPSKSEELVSLIGENDDEEEEEEESRRRKRKKQQPKEMDDDDTDTEDEDEEHPILAERKGLYSTRELILYFWHQRALRYLCVGAVFRFSSSYLWINYMNVYFNAYRGMSLSEIAVYQGWIPIAGGVSGALFGGLLGDR